MPEKSAKDSSPAKAATTVPKVDSDMSSTSDRGSYSLTDTFVNAREVGQRIFGMSAPTTTIVKNA